MVKFAGWGWVPDSFYLSTNDANGSSRLALVAEVLVWGPGAAQYVSVLLTAINRLTAVYTPLRHEQNYKNFSLEVRLAIYGCFCFITLIIYNVFLVLMLFRFSSLAVPAWNVASDLLAVQSPYFLLAFSSNTREIVFKAIGWKKKVTPLSSIKLTQNAAQNNARRPY
uniref:7TM GPCR serpentine receptor class x (Srx) domain-containing protein n=1 Tax=Plectus sambesii TaxID=2011161 RepID=A0A914XDJ5_9BILA